MRIMSKYFESSFMAPKYDRAARLAQAGLIARIGRVAIRP